MWHKKLINTGRTRFKKGLIPWNKGKHHIKVSGNKSPGWKGEKVSYSGLHKWLYRNFGQPKTCEQCKKTGLVGKFINWANKSGDYKRIREDWLRLCRSCHFKYDGHELNRWH